MCVSITTLHYSASIGSVNFVTCRNEKGSSCQNRHYKIRALFEWLDYCEKQPLGVRLLEFSNKLIFRFSFVRINPHQSFVGTFTNVSSAFRFSFPPPTPTAITSSSWENFREIRARKNNTFYLLLLYIYNYIHSQEIIKSNKKCGRTRCSKSLEKKMVREEISGKTLLCLL